MGKYEYVKSFDREVRGLEDTEIETSIGGLSSRKEQPRRDVMLTMVVMSPSREAERFIDEAEDSRQTCYIGSWQRVPR